MSGAVKHAPATPLPWRVRRTSGDPEIVAERGAEKTPEAYIVGCTYSDGAGSRKDAAYVIHAANAYPKLVAALRCIESKHVAGQPEKLREIASEVLRELGEVE